VCRSERKKATKDRWVTGNPEKRRLAKQRWSKANRVKMQSYFRHYYNTNPEKMTERRQLQYAQEIAAVEVFQALTGGKVRRRDGYIVKRILQQLGEIQHDNAAT
jgi:hypothetical protein